MDYKEVVKEKNLKNNFCVCKKILFLQQEIYTPYYRKQYIRKLTMCKRIMLRREVKGEEK